MRTDRPSPRLDNVEATVRRQFGVQVPWAWGEAHDLVDGGADPRARMPIPVKAAR